MIQPLKITVTVPWSFSGSVKAAQSYGRRHAHVKIGGNTIGIKVTASTADFLAMGLATVDRRGTRPIVARLRETGIEGAHARAVRLPGSVTVLEVRLPVAVPVASRCAERLAGSERADVVAVYDRTGQPHFRVRDGVSAVDPGVRVASPVGDPVRRLRDVLGALVVDPAGGRWADSAAWYHPQSGRCVVSVGDGVGRYKEIEAAVAAIVGPSRTEVGDECGKPRGEGWISLHRDASRKKGASASRYQALVEAIRDLWETKADEFAPSIDPDDSDYENHTTQEIVRGYLDQYLDEKQLEQWNKMESEDQSFILDLAFPEDTVKDAADRLERHYWRQTRGASRIRGEHRIDPLDLGVGARTRLARLARGGTMQDLFT